MWPRPMSRGGGVEITVCEKSQARLAVLMPGREQRYQGFWRAGAWQAPRPKQTFLRPVPGQRRTASPSRHMAGSPNGSQHSRRGAISICGGPESQDPAAPGRALENPEPTMGICVFSFGFSYVSEKRLVLRWLAFPLCKANCARHQNQTNFVDSG